MKRRRDIYQRRAYAERRAGLAIDRMIRATQPADQDNAIRWANAWAAVAKFGPTPRKDGPVPCK
jgi:hypothetical protein